MTVHRALNFNAGPAAIPLPALERAQRELIEFAGSGMSIMEHSHRGAVYEAVHDEAIALLRKLMGIPDTHEVLFLQGGASHQFAMVPLNLLPADKVGDYILTGTWSEKALAEAKLIGKTHVAATTAVDGKYARIPRQDEIHVDPAAAYVHMTSNNTIFGTQWAAYPDVGATPLVADLSSDILSRRIDVARFALLYAGAQKNLGPSGLTVVVVDKALVEKGRTDIPKIFRYKVHAENRSLYNTPPTFGIYMLRNVLAWVDEQGGVAAMEKRNDAKGKALYGCIDARAGFYRCPVEPGSRSLMNVVFRLPSEELEKRFLDEAKKADMSGLKGHRSVGGVRASTYNAVSLADVEALVSFMDDFAKRNG